MDLMKNTTHVVIKFNKKTVDGKDSIDLVPKSWTYIDNGKLYCKYPDKREYAKIDMMSKTLSDHKEYWKGFGISVIKEAQNYEQGVRRMNQAFSNSVVLSSNVEELNSSDEECDPKNLSGNELNQCLKDIPSYSKLCLTSEHSTDNDDSLTNCLAPQSTRTSKAKKQTSRHKSLKRTHSCTSSNESNSQSDSSMTSQSFRASKTLRKTSTNKFKQRIHSLNKLKDDHSHSDSLTSQSEASRTKKKTLKSISSNIIPPKSGINEKHIHDDILSPVTKADLESLKRSIEYRIREEAKVTRALFTASQTTTDIEKILRDDKIIDLPKTNLDSFLNFDALLKTDVDLLKKLKCFMVLNINSLSKISENLSTIIPKIINKEVQLSFSAFGRETNGIRKLNFSGTNTYKYLIDILKSKHSDVKEKEIASTMSRWFSGAKDRDGGKKERMQSKKNH